MPQKASTILVWSMVWSMVQYKKGPLNYTNLPNLFNKAKRYIE